VEYECAAIKELQRFRENPEKLDEERKQSQKKPN